MRYALLILLMLLFALPVHAAEVKNLKTGQSGDKGFATYDLAGVPGERQVDVTVVIEMGGVRYRADKLSLSGDFGKGVKVGVGKRILWDLLKDMPAGFEGEAVWDVEASVLPSPVAEMSAIRPEPAGMEFEKEGFRFYKDVVVDTRTGLMWARNANIAGNFMSWNDAIDWVRNLQHGGYSDWRLPTKEELEAFAKRGGSRPADWFNSYGFSGVINRTYWSSSTNAAETAGAWIVYMRNGKVYPMPKTDNYSVWPVRAGR